MLAWGYDNGQFTPRQMAAKAKLEGYEWVALELDDFDNMRFWSEHVFECHQHGLKALCWFTEGYNVVNTPVDAEGSIAELEGPWGGPGDYEGIMNAIEWGQLPSCPLAICTNFSNATPATARPLIDAGFACLTEAYLGDNPNATPDNLNRNAKALGWPTSQPVFGVYNAPFSTYAQWAGWPGVDYLLENVL